MESGGTQRSGAGSGPLERARRAGVAPRELLSTAAAPPRLQATVGFESGVGRLTRLSDQDRLPPVTADAFAAGPGREEREDELGATGKDQQDVVVEARLHPGSSVEGAPEGYLPPTFDTMGRELPPGRGSGIGIRRGKPGHWWDEKGAPAFTTRSGRVVEPRRWRKQPAHPTKSELEQKRRSSRIPDASYDLDGDGVVSQRDYLFAVRFDRDGDGRLAPEEKEMAAAALRAGYADTLVDATGVTGATDAILKQGGGASGVGRAPRVTRGVVVHESDESGWEELASTYSKAYAKRVTVPPYAIEARGGEGGEEGVGFFDTTSTDIGGKLDGGLGGGLGGGVDVVTRRGLAREEGVRTTRGLRRRKRERDAKALAAVFAARLDTRAPDPTRLLARSSAALEERVERKAEAVEAPDLPPDAVKPHSESLERQGLGASAETRSSLLRRRRRSKLEREIGNFSRGADRVPVTLQRSPRGEEAALAPALDPQRAGVSARTRTALLRSRRAQQECDGEVAGRKLRTQPREKPEAAFAATLGGERGWWEEKVPLAEDEAPLVWAEGAEERKERERELGDTRSGGGWRTREDGRALVHNGLHPPHSDPPPSALSLSTRTTSLLDLPRARKKREDAVADKVTALNPFQHAPPSTATDRRTVRRWTDTVLEQQMEEERQEEIAARTQGEEEAPISALLQDHAPLFSSFTRDNVFRDTWNDKRARTAIHSARRKTATQPTFLYGTPAPLASEEKTFSHRDKPFPLHHSLLASHRSSAASLPAGTPQEEHFPKPRHASSPLSSPLSSPVSSSALPTTPTARLRAAVRAERRRIDSMRRGERSVTREARRRVASKHSTLSLPSHPASSAPTLPSLAKSISNDTFHRASALTLARITNAPIKTTGLP